MKVTELMRGDYVAVLGETWEKVSEIYEKGITTTGNGIWLEDEITPIKLTPEILEKNGFSLDETGDWYQRQVSMKERNFWINVAFRDDEVAVYDLDILTGGRSGLNLHADYVHELQNAMRVCRIEKEIIL